MPTAVGWKSPFLWANELISLMFYCKRVEMSVSVMNPCEQFAIKTTSPRENSRPFITFNVHHSQVVRATKRVTLEREKKERNFICKTFWFSSSSTHILCVYVLQQWWPASTHSAIREGHFKPKTCPASISNRGTYEWNVWAPILWLPRLEETSVIYVLMWKHCEHHSLQCRNDLDLLRVAEKNEACLQTFSPHSGLNVVKNMKKIDEEERTAINSSHVRVGNFYEIEHFCAKMARISFYLHSLLGRANNFTPNEHRELLGKMYWQWHQIPEFFAGPILSFTRRRIQSLRPIS